MSEGLRPSEVAQAVGVNRQTLRYYERRGLLEPATRTLGGHRLYSDESVTRLRIIKSAQGLGFSLDEVADLIDTSTHRHGIGRSHRLQERAAAKIAEIDQRITELTSDAQELALDRLAVDTSVQVAINRG